MIGKVCLAVVDYYDSKTKSTRKKARPILIVAGPRNNDYVILPISTISKRENLDPDYDMPIGPTERASLGLDKECFIRTHKQMYIHQAFIVKEKGDLKGAFPDFYLNAITKMEQYQSQILDEAL